MTAAQEPDVVIGIIAAPHGIKGEVKVKMETDFPERFEEMEEVRVRAKSGEERVLQVESVRFHQGVPLIKFKGCRDRNCAEEFRGAELVISPDELAELESDEFYIHDILGLDVYTTGGEYLGKITDVLQGPANDVYVTPRAMIPAVKQFVKEIDLAAGRMVIEPIEGMIEEK